MRQVVDKRTSAILRECLFVGMLLIVFLGGVGTSNAAVYWTRSDDIVRANNDGSGVDYPFIGELGTGALGGSCGVAVDGSHIYWAEQGRNQIARANLDGSAPAFTFISGANAPCGVAVDSGHIYWVNQGDGSIGRANVNGTEVEQGFLSGLSGPCGIAVDGSFVYWGSWMEDSVGRSPLTGGPPQKKFIQDANGACGVAVDSSHIYWGSYDEWIGRANLDGSAPEPKFITGLDRPCGLAVYGSNIYWSEDAASGGAVGKAGLDGSGVTRTFLAGPTRGCGVAVDGQVIPVPNAIEVVASSQMSLGKIKYRRRSARSFTLLAVDVAGPGSYWVKVPAGVGWRVQGQSRSAFSTGGRKWFEFWVKKGRAGRNLSRAIQKKGKARFSFTLHFTEAGHQEVTKQRQLVLLSGRRWASGSVK